MVTMVTLYGPVSDLMVDHGLGAAQKGLPEHATKEITAIGATLLEVINPFMKVTSRENLEKLIRVLQERYSDLFKRFVFLIAEEGRDWDKLFKLGTASNKALREAITSKADLFGEAAIQQIEGTLESLEGFGEWAQKALSDPNLLYSAIFGSPSAELRRNYIAVLMGITAIAAIAFDSVPDWRPEAIPILAEASDDYMTAVEDSFLSYTPVYS